MNATEFIENDIFATWQTNNNLNFPMIARDRVAQWTVRLPSTFVRRTKFFGRWGGRRPPRPPQIDAGGGRGSAPPHFKSADGLPFYWLLDRLNCSVDPLGWEYWTGETRPKSIGN